MRPTDFILLLLAAVTAFVVAFFVLPVLIKYSLKKNYVVVPGKRRPHKKVTPSIGGFAIFVGFIVASLAWLDVGEWLNVRFILASLFIIFLLGIRDDLVPMNVPKKIMGQLAAIAVLLFSGQKINSLYGLFSVYEIPTVVGFILTAFFIIIVTNAFNLIDGLDGLAGSVGLVSIVSFGVWFQLVGDPVYALLCFSMAGAFFSFLIFNWEPAEIFMGDTGAMVGGLFLSILTMHFLTSNEALPHDHVMKFTSTSGAAACFIIVPLCDTVRIIILRLSRGQSPVKPDKNHIHHGLLRLGFSHAKAAVLLSAINLIFIVAAFLFRDFGNLFVFPAVIIGCTVFSITLDRLLVRRAAGREMRDHPKGANQEVELIE
jgi:UDP-GlcNAc:undecaprenyl-phosphate/decaprenyl-phosphate GlcNAc-1-phosphate transferase